MNYNDDVGLVLAICWMLFVLGSIAGSLICYNVMKTHIALRLLGGIGIGISTAVIVLIFLYPIIWLKYFW